MHYNDVYGGNLSLDAAHGAADWSAYFDLYETSLTEQLGCERTDLGEYRSRIRWCDPPTLACGEHWPIEAVGREHFASETNRRFELLFLPPQSAVPPVEYPPGKPIYERRRFNFRPIAVPDQRAGRKLWIRFPLSVVDACRRPWTLMLTSSDGAYGTGVAMADSINANQCADLCFEGLDPAATYTLRLHNDDEEVSVFESIPFAELGALSPASEGVSNDGDEADPLLGDDTWDREEIGADELSCDPIDLE